MDTNFTGKPKEAIVALTTIRELLEEILIGVYLYGSAVTGGLRPKSDVDVLVLTNSGLFKAQRAELSTRLMQISGRPGESSGIRPLEVTVVNQKDVVPWHFPPKFEFMYGEWLREQFEKGDIPGATHRPGFGITPGPIAEEQHLLFGPKVEKVLEPIPWVDIQRAMKDSLPGLMATVKGDERNVILTVARMWYTASTGEFCSKDQAAEWAIPQLAGEHASLLDQAGKAYLGVFADNWEGKEFEVASLLDQMKRSIEPLLAI